MGQEIECTVRLREERFPAKAYLETLHLLIRGKESVKLLFKDIEKVQAKGGILHLEFAGGPLDLELGEAAEKWADKILNPRSRLHKLGVNAGMTVRTIGTLDPDFLAELRSCRVEEATDKADLIFLAAETKTRLAQIPKLAQQLTPAGGLWVIYPKGVTVIREIDVISAGRNAQLKDVKVASFSLSHTGLKFVIPVVARKG